MKWMPSFKRKEKPKDTTKYQPVCNHTISLNSGAMLPKKALLDPLWNTDIIKVAREEKVYEDAVSLPVQKMPINPKLVFMIIIGVILFVAIALPILNQQGLLDTSKITEGFGKVTERIVPGG